jgi:DNA polymerase III subunit beta
MKLVIAQDALNGALSIVSRAVSTKNTIPELSGILLSAQDSTLTLRATDMEFSIASSVSARVIEPGETVLPARYLSDLVRRIPFGDLELATDFRNFTTVLKWGKSQYVIHGFSAERFPALPEVDESSVLIAAQPILREFLRQSTFACAHDEAKPWLTGVLFSLRDEVLTGVATDGVRIAYREARVQNEGGHRFSVIIPGRSLNELTRLLSGEPADEARINVTANQVFFDLGRVKVISRLLEGQYPDVMRLVPQQYPTQMVVSRAEFLDAIERAALIAQNGAVKIGISSGKVTITSHTPEVGQVYEEVAAGDLEGDPLEIGFNSKLLIEYLKVLDEAEFRFQCSGSRNPARLQPSGESNSLYVVLPLIAF